MPFSADGSPIPYWKSQFWPTLTNTAYVPPTYSYSYTCHAMLLMMPMLLTEVC